MPGYVRIDLRSSWDATQSVQLYGIVQNVLNQHYGLSATYFNLATANAASAATGTTFSDPRTITPAAPLAAYAGVKIKF